MTVKTKIKIQIKSYFGNILFESERETVKEALQDAVLRGAVLQDADLQGADLRGADLRGAVLRGAVLRGADLQDAVLQGADLRGAVLQDAVLQDAVLQDAVLRGAVLQGADLRGADLRGVPLSQLGDYINQCSRDMLFIFGHLKKELPGLRKALVEGRINGTQYSGDCACLIGTLGKLDGGTTKVCNTIPFYEKGLQNYGEQWFWQIREGDTPKNNEFAKHAVKLIDTILKPKKAGK